MFLNRIKAAATAIPFFNIEPKDEVVKLEPLNIGRLDKVAAAPFGVISGFAWRCVWVETDGNTANRSGATYALGEEFLRSFIKVFETVIDPNNPQVMNRPGKIEMVKVHRDLFDELINNTTGVVHITAGPHFGDSQFI